MGRRVRQEKGGKDPFGTCLPRAETSLMSPQFTWPWWTLPNNCWPGEKVKLALLIFIVVDLPQLTGNEA